MNLNCLKNALTPFIKDNFEYLKDLYPENKDKEILNRVVSECATEKLLSALNKKFKFLPVTKMFEGQYSPVLEALEDEKILPSDSDSEIVPKVFDFPICFLGSEEISCGAGSVVHLKNLLACLDHAGNWYTVISYEIWDGLYSVKTFIKTDRTLYNFENFRRYFPKKYRDYLFEE